MMIHARKIFKHFIGPAFVVTVFLILLATVRIRSTPKDVLGGTAVPSPEVKYSAKHPNALGSHKMLSGKNQDRQDVLLSTLTTEPKLDGDYVLSGQLVEPSTITSEAISDSDDLDEDQELYSDNGKDKLYAIILQLTGQQVSGVHALINLQCRAHSLNLPIVILEPVISRNKFRAMPHIPINESEAPIVDIPPPEPALQFDDLFDLANFNKISGDLKYGQLAPRDIFFENAPRKIILVIIFEGEKSELPELTRLWPNRNTSDSKGGCFNPLTSQLAIDPKYQLYQITQKGFCVVKVILFRMTHGEALIFTEAQLRKYILAGMKITDFTLVFNIWMPKFVFPGIKGRECIDSGYHSLKEQFQPSKRLLANANYYKKHFLNSTESHVTLMIRLELIYTFLHQPRSQYGNWSVKKCLDVAIEKVKEFQNNRSPGVPFVTLDIGRGDQIDIIEQIKNCLEEVAGSVEGLSILEKYISVAAILQCYGVKKSISYIRDNEANVEEAMQLMIKLTRVASRQDPPMTEASLYDLLQDMLILQSEVFTCVSQDTCHQVFTESLLCSNDKSKITLAGELLTVTPSPASPRSPSPGTPTRAGSPMNHFNYSLSYETSLKLVHNAAKEYFNSAQSFMDDDMDLARKCLDLFPTPPPPELRSELNLIASLALLDDFGIKILPVQVRLCENKLDLIRSCLDSSTTAYKNVLAILRLSKLLGLDTSIEQTFSEEDDVSEGYLSACKMSEGRGHSLIFVALTALQKQDFKLAHQLCCELVEACFPSAWEVCRSLALDSEFSDLPAKLTLLNFAVTHCPPEEIVHILKERQILEAQLLTAKHSAFARAQRGSIGKVSVTTSVGHGVQQVVRKGAGAIQQLMGQRLGSGLSPTRSQHSVLANCIDSLQSCSEIYPVKEKAEATLSCHAFFSHEEKQLQGRKSIYDSFDSGNKEQSQSSLEALLRAKLLFNIHSEQKEDCTEVLLKLAEGCSESDTHLMLGYLLAITKAEDSAVFFSKLVPNKFSLELAIYYTCLQLYATTASLDEPLTNPHPYLNPPVQLVEHVTSHVTSSSLYQSHPHVAVMRKYQELLDDFTQGQVLLGLGLGIDVEQFTSDPSYKRDIILSLARSLNPKVCLTSLSLARHHSIPEWEVYMTMMDCLLTTAKLNASDVQQKMKELSLLDPLLKCPQETADYLRSNTYANIPGNKYALLIQYFTLMEQCAEHGATVKEDISVAVHLQLLKKFKSALPSMDYKLLMSGEGDPLLLLTPLLSSSNVHVVAKVASKIPCQGEGTLNAGMVFSAYVLKVFWKGEGKGHEPHSTADWLHRFESCHDYLVHLNAQELHHTVLGIILSKRSLKFELETRVELTKRAIKFTQQMIKKDSASGKTLKDGVTPYADMKHEFERILVHIQNLSSPELHSETGGIDKDRWKMHLTNFDLSGSNTEKVHSLALEMIDDGVFLDSVQLILSLANTVNPHKLDLCGIVNESLTNCLKQVEQPLIQNTTSVPDLSTLERILSSVSLHESESLNTNVLSILKSFCGDYTKPAHIRRAIVQLIEKYLVLPEEEHRLLFLYQTQSVLLEQFEMEASLADISSAEAQQQLFTSLLTKADSVDKLLSLMTLLDNWENQQSRSSYSQCWIDLLRVIAKRSEDFSYVTVVRAGLKDIPSEVDNELFTALSTKSWGVTTKFSLICSNEDMFNTAVEKLVQVRPIAPEVDADLLELILVRRKLGESAVVNSPLFPLLCEYIKATSVPSVDKNLFSRVLHCSEAEVSERLLLSSPAERFKDAAQQLHSSGLKVEAGSLLLSGHRLHPALATLNDAVEYLRRMI